MGPTADAWLHFTSLFSISRFGTDSAQASGVAAFQTNRNVKLSEGAWAHSDPNLEIENNDVKCSHASAVGPIDPEHRFYLESRGVPPHVAERLLVSGFFEEVIAQMPTTELGQHVRSAVAGLPVYRPGKSSSSCTESA